MLMFVYGTLKRGYHNHYLLESVSAEFVDTAVTSDAFQLVGAGYPRMIRGGGVPVKGELFAVPDSGAVVIDGLELPYGYRRETLTVTRPDGTTAEAEAYIYGDDPAWPVNAGWVDFGDEWPGKYRRLSPDEHDVGARWRA